jgi:hypothetical protein
MAALRGGECRHSRPNDKPRYNKLRRACQWRAREATFKTFRLETLSARWSLRGRLDFCLTRRFRESPALPQGRAAQHQEGFPE